MNNPPLESGDVDVRSDTLSSNSWTERELLPLTWIMAEDRDSLRRRVYYAARDGMSITLYALLAEKSKSELSYYLEHVIEEDGQKCTPLIVAAINGHENVVKMLLNRFNPNLEQEGIVQLDGYVIEGATALWCAAGAGHFNVVKNLVKHGADVNHSTRTNSTPLRAACFDGRLDIVRYLVENGASIHIANKYNNTCLMIASYRGHLDVVSYLLSKHANTEAITNCGATALHFAAEHGHLHIVKKLLKWGAKITKNKIGMTPLITAAERTKSGIVEYLVEKDWCSNDEAIEAFELLGASYANDKDHYSLDKAYYYLEQAMKMRFSETYCKPKVILPPVAAYDNHVECRNLEELQAVKDDLNGMALHMEALVIRERILGPDNPEVPHPIIFRGAVCADVGRFDRCLSLWLHALNLRYRNKVSVRKDLLRFAQLFSQILHVGEEIPFQCIEDVLSITVSELERNLAAAQIANDDVRDSLVEEFEDNMHTMLYLLIVTTKLLKNCTPEQEHHIYQLVYQINKLPLVTQDGSTPLHLVVNANTPVDDFHTRNICKFPCAATADMLIQCGADVNAVDNAGNTPLHIIVTYRKPITDFLTLHLILTKLVKAGAHLDCVNNMGETPCDAVLTGVADIILKGLFELNLKCIAAKAVRKYNIPYEGVIPATLVSFTDMHGVPRKIKRS